MKKFTTVFVIASLLCVFSVTQSHAQELGFKGIGGRVGFVDAENTDGTIMFGAHAHLGEIIENLVLIPSVDYFSKSSVDFLSINGNVRYYFPASESIDFFAGGGLAIVRASVPSVNTPFGPVGGSSTKLGLNLKGGAEIPLGESLVGTAELIYVASDFTQIKILAGITYMFGGK